MASIAEGVVRRSRGDDAVLRMNKDKAIDDYILRYPDTVKGKTPKEIQMAALKHAIDTRATNLTILLFEFDLSQLDAESHTLLMYNMGESRHIASKAVIRILAAAMVKVGIGIDQRDAVGETAMWKATNVEEYATAMTLMCFGASANITNLAGEKFMELDVWQHKDFQEFVKVAKEAEDIGIPLLHNAVRTLEVGIVKKILKYGNDEQLVEKDGNGQLAMQWASIETKAPTWNLHIRMDIDSIKTNMKNSKNFQILEMLILKTPTDGSTSNIPMIYNIKARRGLIATLQYGDINGAIAMIKAGANAAETDSLHRNALHVAVEVCQDAIVVENILVRYPLTLMVKDSRGKTPLHLAAELDSELCLYGIMTSDIITGDMKVKLLDMKDNDGYTALDLALLSKKDPLVIELLRSTEEYAEKRLAVLTRMLTLKLEKKQAMTAWVNKSHPPVLRDDNSNEFAAIEDAIQNTDNVTLSKLLYGFDFTYQDKMDTVDEEEGTILHLIISKRELDAKYRTEFTKIICKAAAKMKVDIANIPDSNEMTPLMNVALMLDLIEDPVPLIDTLIDYGAKQETNGMTTLDILVNTFMQDWPEDGGIGLELKDRAKKCIHALFLRSFENRWEGVRLIFDLIKYGTVNYEIRLALENAYAQEPKFDRLLHGDSKDNVMHAAVRAKRMDLVKGIVSMSNNVRRLLFQKNDSAHTPLHLAVLSGDPEMYTHLLYAWQPGDTRRTPVWEHVKDNAGKTALDLAIEGDQIIMIDIRSRFQFVVVSSNHAAIGLVGNMYDDIFAGGMEHLKACLAMAADVIQVIDFASLFCAKESCVTHGHNENEKKHVLQVYKTFTKHLRNIGEDVETMINRPGNFSREGTAKKFPWLLWAISSHNSKLLKEIIKDGGDITFYTHDDEGANITPHSLLESLPNITVGLRLMMQMELDKAIDNRFTSLRIFLNGPSYPNHPEFGRRLLLKALEDAQDEDYIVPASWWNAPATPDNPQTRFMEIAAKMEIPEFCFNESDNLDIKFTKEGHNALYYAALNNQLENVVTLLDKGSKLSDTDRRELMTNINHDEPSPVEILLFQRLLLKKELEDNPSELAKYDDPEDIGVLHSRVQMSKCMNADYEDAAQRGDLAIKYNHTLFFRYTERDIKRTVCWEDGADMSNHIQEGIYCEWVGARDDDGHGGNCGEKYSKWAGASFGSTVWYLKMNDIAKEFITYKKIQTTYTMPTTDIYNVRGDLLKEEVLRNTDFVFFAYKADGSWEKFEGDRYSQLYVKKQVEGAGGWAGSMARQLRDPEYVKLEDTPIVNIDGESYKLENDDEGYYYEKNDEKIREYPRTLEEYKALDARTRGVGAKYFVETRTAVVNGERVEVTLFYGQYLDGEGEDITEEEYNNEPLVETWFYPYTSAQKIRGKYLVTDGKYTLDGVENDTFMVKITGSEQPPLLTKKIILTGDDYIQGSREPRPIRLDTSLLAGAEWVRESTYAINTKTRTEISPREFATWTKPDAGIKVRDYETPPGTRPVSSGVDDDGKYFILGGPKTTENRYIQDVNRATFTLPSGWLYPIVFNLEFLGQKSIGTTAGLGVVSGSHGNTTGQCYEIQRAVNIRSHQTITNEGSGSNRRPKPFINLRF